MGFDCLGCVCLAESRWLAMCVLFDAVCLSRIRPQPLDPPISQPPFSRLAASCSHHSPDPTLPPFPLPPFSRLFVPVIDFFPPSPVGIVFYGLFEIAYRSAF